MVLQKNKHILLLPLIKEMEPTPVHEPQQTVETFNGPMKQVFFDQVLTGKSGRLDWFEGLFYLGSHPSLAVAVAVAVAIAVAMAVAVAIAVAVAVAVAAAAVAFE